MKLTMIQKSYYLFSKILYINLKDRIHLEYFFNTKIFKDFTYSYLGLWIDFCSCQIFFINESLRFVCNLFRIFTTRWKFEAFSFEEKYSHELSITNTYILDKHKINEATLNGGTACYFHSKYPHLYIAHLLSVCKKFMTVCRSLPIFKSCKYFMNWITAKNFFFAKTTMNIWNQIDISKPPLPWSSSSVEFSRDFS